MKDSMDSDLPRKVFRYSIEFHSFANPIDTTDAFTNLCRQELADRGIDLFSNHLMNFQTYAAGMVFREGGTVGESDRNSICDWILRQPIHGQLTLGYLEPFEDSTVAGDFAGDSYNIENHKC